jgi:hypothetical protein
MIGLNLYDRPAEGTNQKVSLTRYFDGWKRAKRAVGGYHLGKLTIKNRGMQELTDFYNTWLGFKIVESTFGITSYEGIIWQLDLSKNGINYRRTLNPKYWHNRVKVFYRDSSGDQQTAAWSENTDSSGIYGVMEYIYTLGASNSTGATAARDRALEAYAWPRSRAVGGISVGETAPSLSGDGLYITTAGLSATMNWQQYEADTAATASSLISTLVGATEFVTAGRIETNSLSTAVECAAIPKRIGDLIENLIGEGDSSGNLWKGGVYANQEFVYEQIPTTVDYVLQNGALYRSGGVIELPSLINPGFYVRDTNAPSGYQPPGTSNIWDDPQVFYCDEVEYVYPDILKLKFPGERQSVEVVASLYPSGFEDLYPPGTWESPMALPPKEIYDSPKGLPATPKKLPTR